MVSEVIKVLIVDDSAFMRLLLGDMLSEEGFLVVGTAVDGKDAVDKTLELKPDVVLLDMNMGEYDGLFAVKEIMVKCPTPILILSAVGNTNLDPIFDALEHGAVDYINKPVRGGSKIRLMNNTLVSAVRRVCRAQPKAANIIKDGVNKLAHTFSPDSPYDIIAIGASTGGPSAIEKVLTTLPANLNVPVIIAQHMPSNFIHSFANRLNGLSKLDVLVGRPGMEPTPGRVIICPGEGNSVLDANTRKFTYTDQEYREFNNPSINAIMESVAYTYGKRSIGVLLTGMGKDGVKGMKAIRQKGGMTIAQDEQSSIIYGMPKIAYETGAAEVVLDVKEIGLYLVNCL